MESSGELSGVSSASVTSSVSAFSVTTLFVAEPPSAFVPKLFRLAKFLPF
jgi:hypothetical protein